MTRAKRPIAATAAMIAVGFGAATAEARFLQVDPVGYKDQINLYAYVGNDPINARDPTGTTCTSAQQGEKTVYSCRIDSVAIVKDGQITTRPTTPAEDKKFASFNARYSAAVNRLMSDPNKPVTVAPINGKLGSFQTTAGKAAESLISREFAFTKGLNEGTDLATAGVYNPNLGVVEGARTYVSQSGLADASKAGIVHDGGLHGTYEEWTGNLQDHTYPLGKIEHQQQYNQAACILLGDC